MKQLSYAARRLWAKKGRDGTPFWLPLLTHLEDAAAVAAFIWQRWLPEGTKRVIAEGCGCTVDEVERLLVFILAIHDIGKATPVFQAKPAQFLPDDLDERLALELATAGLPMQPYSEFSAARSSPHALAGMLILEAAGCNRNVAVIIGSHHGKPPSSGEAIHGGEESQITNFCVNKEGRAAWDAVRAELVEYALSLAGYASFDELPVPDMRAQVLLSGLTILADWIASNESYFPYISPDDAARPGMGALRLKTARGKLDFLKTAWQPEGWAFPPELFAERFGFPPRSLQSAVIETANGIAEPGIFVIEAPMGVGKTEPALAVAEIFAMVTGRSGVFFALPTQATSDGMFPRMRQWIAGLGSGKHSVELVHGKAQFNEDFASLARIGGSRGIAEEDDETCAVVYTWFEGRKKALLADFAVGTVDQLLQLALKQKHVMLRHLALANKVVIIDECHAYDAYMNVYLHRALQWLGAYRVPVILLSATLPAQKRDELVQAYLGKKKAKQLPEAGPPAYPCVTYTDGREIVPPHRIDAGVAPVSVSLERLSDAQITETLGALLSQGGCAGIILNTVKRAQAVAASLQAQFGDDVALLHSRFTATDRLAKEGTLRAELGKPSPEVRRPARRIVIGTQVIEQSLDLDFDVLITDLCPVDLLLQRIGRLHRHGRPRPAKLESARCFVLMPEDDALDPGSAAVYGEYLLLRTKALLPPRVVLPDDVSPLVQAVYGGDRAALPYIPEGYDRAEQDWEKLTREKEKGAKAFRILAPSFDKEDTMEGWLGTAVTDAAGEAAVRDSEDSVEVIAVRRGADGGLYLLSSGEPLPRGDVPDAELARRIARESLRLPAALCMPGKIDELIYKLETQSKAEAPRWQESPWLRGSLILVFDADNTARLLGYRLQYDAFFGLTYEKEDGVDGGKRI